MSLKIRANLDFTLTTTLKADLSGLFFDFTNSKLSSLTATGPLITQFVAKADGVSNLANGVNLNGQKVPNFDVGMEFGLAGIGSKNQNIQSESFVLSDTAHNLSMDDLHPTGETGTMGVRDLGSGQKLEAVAPYAPTATTTAATPYQVTTLEETPITIQASSLATDLNSGAVLKVDKIGTGAQGPQYGTVQINNDGSLTYTPTTLDYKVNGILTGNQDAFQVGVKDNFGGTVTSFVTVHATPVADAPAVKVQVLTPHDGDPVTEVRLLVTAQSGDFGTVNAGSDFIQSIALGGTAATDATQITDSLGLLSGNTIIATSNQGFFQDEIDLVMPTGKTINDTLAVTAAAAEIEGTGSPATASATKNQLIAIDNVQSQTDLTFQTSGQSIWDTGAGFSKDFSTGFLGFDKSTSFGFTTTPIVSLGGSIEFRVGFEADLKISAGDISATLPYRVGLDSTYNTTTDTLQITATDAQLGGGHFTAHGPSGAYTFGVDLGLKFKAAATILGTGTSFKTTVGSFTKPVTGYKLNSNTAGKSITLPSSGVGAGPLASLNLAFPNVNTSGSNSSPGTISGTGTSNDMANLTGDLVELAKGLFGSFPLQLIDEMGPPESKVTTDILDVFLGIGSNLIQKFDLNSSGLVPALVLEDGTAEPLMFGVPLTILNASSHDQNQDGKIGMSLGLVPQATLTNNTSVGASMNASITAGVFDYKSLGPVTAYKTSFNVPLGTLGPLYSNTFGLNGFGQHTVTQTV
jgi:VCBS repeat-containing protein